MFILCRGSEYIAAISVGMLLRWINMEQDCKFGWQNLGRVWYNKEDLM